MAKRFYLTSSFLFLLLQSEKLTFKKTCNIRASASLHGVTPVETWSSKAMGTSVAAYIFFTIFGPVTFLGASNFSNLLAPQASGYKSLMSRPESFITISLILIKFDEM